MNELFEVIEKKIKEAGYPRKISVILMNNFIDFIKTKTSNYLIISTLKTSNENIIHINQHSYTSSWLNAVIPFQIMCTYLPECNGINSSDPVYGDFATTVGTRIE